MNLFLVCSNPLLDAECKLSDVPELSVLGILFSSRLIYSYNSYTCSCFHLFPPDCTSDCSHFDMMVLILFVLSGSDSSCLTMKIITWVISLLWTKLATLSWGLQWPPDDQIMQDPSLQMQLPLLSSFYTNGLPLPQFDPYWNHIYHWIETITLTLSSHNFGTSKFKIYSR